MTKKALSLLSFLLVVALALTLGCSNSPSAPKAKGSAASALANNNPVITDANADVADPDTRFFAGKYYIYPTYCPSKDWNSKYFKCWSSTDLVHWTDEGIILNSSNVTWSADNECWAPTVAFVNNTYYMYFCMNGQIGVATSTSPKGPFKDAVGSALLSTIDPCVFTDSDGQSYLYYGQSSPKVRKLNANMTSFATSEAVVSGSSGFNEASEVFKRNGIYYYMWSENDTRSTNYQVAYGTMTNPLGPITYKGIILHYTGTIIATGHNSVINASTDDWYIVYHRFHISGGSGMFREVCIDHMYFNSDGTIQAITPTLAGIQPVTTTPPPTPSPTSTSTPTPTPGGSTSYYKIQNQGNGLCVDGYGYTTNGSYCRQYASGSSYNQQWSIVSASGSYVYLVNRATGLYLDGYGKTANGSPCQQYASSGSANQQWLLVANGSYTNIKNNATGMMLDSMGYTTNGSYECQYSSSGSTGQAYSFIKQ
jgi:hypothetical protein